MHDTLQKATQQYVACYAMRAARHIAEGIIAFHNINIKDGLTI